MMRSVIVSMSSKSNVSVAVSRRPCDPELIGYPTDHGGVISRPRSGKPACTDAESSLTRSGAARIHSRYFRNYRDIDIGFKCGEKKQAQGRRPPRRKTRHNQRPLKIVLMRRDQDKRVGQIGCPGGRHVDPQMDAACSGTRMACASRALRDQSSQELRPDGRGILGHGTCRSTPETA